MTRFWQNRTGAAAAAEVLKVYAHPQRLMILSALLDIERNVGEIAEATGIGQPTLGQQLGELRRANLVCTRKEAQQVWYSLADSSVTQCIEHIEATFGQGEPQTSAPGQRPPVQHATSSKAPNVVPDGVAAFARIL